MSYLPRNSIDYHHSAHVEVRAHGSGTLKSHLDTETAVSVPTLALNPSHIKINPIVSTRRWGVSCLMS